MQKPVRLRAAEDLPWRHLNVKNEIKLKIKRGCAKYFLSLQLFVIFLRKKLVLLVPRCWSGASQATKKATASWSRSRSTTQLLYQGAKMPKKEQNPEEPLAKVKLKVDGDIAFTPIAFKLTFHVMCLFSFVGM